MSRELLIAGMLLSLSTILKVASILALCQAHMHMDEVEHTIHPLHKKVIQTSQLRV